MQVRRVVSCWWLPVVARIFLSEYSESMKRRIYLDYASVAPVLPKVSRAMMHFEKHFFANPESLHQDGLKARSEIEKSRQTIAEIIGCHSDEIVFTSGGTESDNLAVLGSLRFTLKNFLFAGKKPHIVTTNIEHSAVRQACKQLEQEGVAVTYVPVDSEGLLNPQEIKKAILPTTVLVSVMFANNEIGTVQPIKEIAKVIRKVRRERNLIKENVNVYPLFHTDATQAVAHLEIKVPTLGVDLLSWNGSKLGGPRGVGGLYIRRGVEIESLFYGGGQEKNRRAGTENGPGITGLALAMQLVEKDKDKETLRLKKIQDYTFAGLTEEFPDIKINGSIKNRLPNNVNITVPNIPSELLLFELDARGISVSSQSACRSSGTETSYVIEALQEARQTEQIEISTQKMLTKLQKKNEIVSGLESQGVIRLSFGKNTRLADIKYFIKSLKDIRQKLDLWYNGEAK